MSRQRHEHRVEGVNRRLREQMEDAAMDRYPDEGLERPAPRRVQTVRAHLHSCRCEGRHHAGCSVAQERETVLAGVVPDTGEVLL